MPVSAENDREAIRIALASLPGIPAEKARVVRIKNTLELEELEVSESLRPEVEASPRLQILAGPEALPFDSAGNLIGRSIG
jgi:hypothetical protein